MTAGTRHVAIHEMNKLTNRTGARFSIFLLLLSMASTQIGASIAKRLFPVLGPEGVCFVRLIVASALLGAVWRPWRSKLTVAQLKIVTAYGVALGLMNLSYYLALQRLPLGLTVALEFIGPLSVALFFSRRLLDFIWALFAVFGLLLIVPISKTGASTDLVGVGLALMAGAAWASYIVFGKRASLVAPSGVSTSVGMFVALLTIVPAVVPISASHAHLNSFANPVVLAMGLGVGILSSAFPYSLEMIALRHLPAKNFGILLSLSPAVAALAGLVILKESLSLTQWLAVACILTGSLGSAVSIKNEQVSPPIEV